MNAHAVEARVRAKNAGNRNFMMAPEKILHRYPIYPEKRVETRVKILVIDALVWYIKHL